MSRQAIPVQRGEVIDYKNSGETTISVGDVIVLSNMCGIAETEIKSGESGAVRLDQVWEIGAVTGSAFAVGDIVYWNTTNKYATKTPTNNTLLGIVVAPKASSEAKCRVKIGVLSATISNPTKILEHTHNTTTGKVELAAAATDWSVEPVPSGD
ncbi:MAG: DUF2190 family protein [Synergistaceae bacterium]|nr:DUF2190 family protein [Synergistaceae bacterium]